MINSGVINGFPINADAGDAAESGIVYMDFLSAYDTSTSMDDFIANMSFLSAYDTSTSMEDFIGNTMNFSEASAYISSFTSQVGIGFVSNINQIDDVELLISLIFVEAYDVDDTVTSKGAFLFDVAAGLDLKTLHSFAFLFSLTSGINFTGDATLDRQTAIAFIEAITLADSSEAKHRAIFSIAEAIVMQNDLSSGFAFDFLEALGIDGSEAIEYLQVFNIIESIVVNDDSTSQARLFFSSTEGLNVDDSLDIRGILLANFAEGINISGVINTPEGVFEAWTVNAETGAPFKYTNFPFNSFAMIDGTYYGADESGLFSLDGDTDDGENISAAIKTGLMNLGTTLFKRIPRAYFGYTSDGQVLFKTISTESGKNTERWYALTEKTADDTTNNRLKLARGVKSVYWQFEIVNVDGADFDFDEIKLMPTILKRRR